MKKGDLAELNVQKMLCSGKDKDLKTYLGIIREYHKQKAQIDIVLQEGNLVELSLDAIYVCTIHSDNEKVYCTGRVGERYCSKAGKCLVFDIENGFYKININ